MDEYQKIPSLYKRAEFYVKTPIEPCPVCGAEPELWKYSKDFENGPVEKVVMCSTNSAFGPQEEGYCDGCLLYMPPQAFYNQRISGAVKYWNEHAKALNAMRRGNNWSRSKVLRTQPHDTDAQ